MLKKIMIAGAASLLLSGAALAAAPSNDAECQALLKSTFTLFSEKPVPEADAKKAEEMLETLADQCTAKDYAAAEKTAAALKAMAPKS